jgi:ribonucleoside-triphosphate reductase
MMMMVKEVVKMYRVKKRNGKIVRFDIKKIEEAMEAAFKSVDRKYNDSILDLLALKVTADFEEKIKDDIIHVEDIQDSVENVLSEAGYSDVAKSYILYRKQHEKLRNVENTMIDYKK